MKNLIERVDGYRELILSAERHIWQNPETGYKEWKTSKYLEEQLERLGYTLHRAGDIPGFTTELDTGRKGPTLLILCELDSLICPNHPEADKTTGAVHCCGHNAQCAALLGVAAALSEKGALDKLCGKIRLCAVPAEELIEIEYRNSLMRDGVIKYYGGKGEFLRRGYFDGVDLAFMVHASTEFAIRGGSVGCRAKRISYKGKSAHAGGSPWSGINALYAATCGLNAANALRETFPEGDLIRFHPIVTHGGEAVNAIPELVTVEAYVRGRTFEAIERANTKINRALVGAALSIGAQIEIDDMPGYSPLVNSKDMTEVSRRAFYEVFPDGKISISDTIGTGSTDMGDLSMIMPAIHPYAAGSIGTSHGMDYYIENPEAACVDSAKWQLAMLYMLLSENASLANRIVSEYEPTFKSKDEFLMYLDSLKLCGDRIKYNENSGAEVSW